MTAVALGGVLLGARAADARERLELGWTAPATCPTRDEMIAEVDRLLGGRATAPARTITVSVVVDKVRAAEWRLSLVTPGGRGRELRGPSCLEVADAAALILALLVDPTAVLAPLRTRAPAATAPAPRPAVVPATAPAAVAEVPVAPPRPVRPPLRPAFRLRLYGGADVAILPSVSPGFGVAGVLVLGRQRVELGGEGFPPRTSEVSALAGSGGRVDLIVGTLGTCRLLTRGALEVAPCTAVEIGRLHAVGFGVTAPGAGTALWGAWRGGLHVGWPATGRVGVTGRAEAVVPFVRPRFVLENVGAVHRPAPVGARLLAGVEYRF